MQTFKIVYDFFDEASQKWKIGMVVILAESEGRATLMFKNKCENYTDIIYIDELRTSQIIWANLK